MIKKQPPIDHAELRSMVDRAKRELATAEGKQRLEKAFQKGYAEAQRLKAASVPNVRSLKQPITI